ncbi:hypothetical protein DERF_010520 [Dermatophagoides farinae]|uniref:Uncharacterized protein n=1 Tax=Dermatophagoides farinae TaxID=6954 RepID=A0A922HW29_DERFA|nr:hypothetical protein DERF_010520 [Dermatophagoides farinae]
MEKEVKNFKHQTFGGGGGGGNGVLDVDFAQKLFLYICIGLDWIRNKKKDAAIVILMVVIVFGYFDYHHQDVV